MNEQERAAFVTRDHSFGAWRFGHNDEWVGVTLTNDNLDDYSDLRGEPR